MIPKNVSSQKKGNSHERYTAFLCLQILLMITFLETVPLARAWARNQLRGQSSTLVQFRKGQASKVRCYASSSSSSVGSQSKTALSNLVSVKDSLEVFRSSENGGVVFVDGSFYHKGARNGRTEFEEGPRIPGSQYCDMVDISTTKELFPELNPKGLWGMLPPKSLFAAAMDAFGIQNSDRVIIYGREGSIFTPRTWFLFKTMGHEKVQLMQGPLEEWMALGGPVDEEPTTVLLAKDLDLSKPAKYQARDPFDVVDMNDMLNIVQGKEEATLIDPRGSSFSKKGHIPGSIHIPYASLVDSNNRLKLKDPEELKAIFEEAGVDIQSEKPIVTTCGSGVSVCHVYLALQECGRKAETKIYDGSWNEWSKNPDAPKVVPEK